MPSFVYVRELNEDLVLDVTPRDGIILFKVPHGSLAMQYIDYVNNAFFQELASLHSSAPLGCILVYAEIAESSVDLAQFSNLNELAEQAALFDD